MRIPILACLWATTIFSCGGTEVITPQPLFVVDTYPSNGAQIASGQVPVVISFSAPVDPETLAQALLLEETAGSGTPIRVIPTALAEYLQQDQTATYQLPALSADTAYSLTVKKEVVRAMDGTRLLTDIVRRFRTLP